MRRIAARGTVINAAFTVGLDTLNLLRAFIVASLLVPGDYGVWTILVVAIGTLAITVAATWALERRLLREVTGYLRAAPGPA